LSIPNTKVEVFPKISLEPIQKLANIYEKYKQHDPILFSDWIVNWNIKSKHSHVLSKILNSNDQSIKSLNEDILKGNICIGNKNDKIWKNIEENISMMNDEHINDIPEKIALNNQTIKNIDGEIKSLKKRKKKLIKENNNYLQRPFGYYIYKDKIPKLKEITSNIIKLEDHLSSQLYDFMNDDEKKENQNEFINLNDSLQFYNELHHDKLNEFKQYPLK